jgi:EmrB/QacA subfamily drug resistance transporter
VASSDSSRKWWILTAMGGVMGLILLDETVVAVALPDIRDELGMSEVAAHWVINAYLLVFTGLAAAAGRMGDIIGLRDFFLISVALFVAASLACGFAPSGGFLIGARAVQGLAAAAIFPISLAMVTRAFPAEQRGLALGIYAAAGTVFLALGPLVGGLLVDMLSWRWIFWINPPLGAAVAAVVAAAWMKQPPRSPDDRLDVVGLITLVGGIGMLVFAIMQGPEWGWSHPTIATLLIAGAAVIAVFVFAERRIAKPLINVELFGGGSFTSSNLVIFTAQFNQMAVVVFGAIYFQDVLKMTPLLAGIALLPGVGVIPLLATPTGQLTDTYGPRPVAIYALVLGVVGFLWLTVAVSYDHYGWLVPALIAWGASNCALFVAPRRVVMNAIPQDKQGQAGGVLMTAQLLGGTIAIAVCGTIFAMSGDYRMVFLAPAVLTAAVLAISWFALDRHQERYNHNMSLQSTFWPKP